MDLTIRTSQSGSELNIWGSEKRRFVTGGVTIDSSEVSADGDGNKLLSIGQPLGYDAVSGKWEPYVAPVKASKLFGTEVANTALLITALAYGVIGNSIKVQLLDPSGNNQALAVSISGDTIVVSLATSAEGAITSTAAEIAAAINAHLLAKQLVVASADVGESSGEVAVAAVAATALAGGAAAGVEPSVLLAENVDCTLGDQVASAVDQARVIEERLPVTVDDYLRAALIAVGITFA